MLFMKFPAARKYVFSLFIMLWCLILTSGNLKKPTYALYEPWLVYICIIMLLNSFMCLEWKFLAVPHVINMIYLTIRLKLKYQDLPVMYYVIIFLTSLLVPLGCMIQSSLVREMLHLLKENKELIETIRTILTNFPEGVVIQVKDKITNKYVVKFANLAARQDLLVSE